MEIIAGARAEIGGEGSDVRAHHPDMMRSTNSLRAGIAQSAPGSLQHVLAVVKVELRHFPLVAPMCGFGYFDPKSTRAELTTEVRPLTLLNGNWKF